MKLYQYAILYVPSKKKDEIKAEKAKVLAPITEVIAKDDAEAGILAARAIPEEYLDRLDEIILAVRPF